MENGKIGGVRTPNPLNRWTQNLAWVIMSAISPGMPKMQVIASLGKWVKYHSRAVFNFLRFKILHTPGAKTTQPIFMLFDS